jgi:membrane-associated protease RseP (regulator of RpoE activity)
MKLLQPNLLSVTALILAISPVFAQEMEQAPAPTPKQPKQEKQERMKPEREMRDGQRSDSTPSPEKMGRPQPWRIGMLVEPVDPALRAHLSIPENTGVVVSQVVPGSPAAQAGFQKNDIITSANGKPVGELDQLRQHVEQAAMNSAPLRLTFIRKGKREDASITPPAAARADARIQPPANRINDAIQPMFLRMAEQHKKLAEKIERQQQELEELSKEVKQLRKELKEQDKKPN